MATYKDILKEDLNILRRMCGKQLWVHCICTAYQIGSRPTGEIYLSPIRVTSDSCLAKAYPVDTDRSFDFFWSCGYYTYDLRTLDIIKPVEIITAQELKEFYEDDEDEGEYE